MSMTCEVGIFAAERDGRLRFQAFGLECGQTVEQRGKPVWRDAYLDAELDALRLDGHECPVTRQGNHQRLIPRDRLVTKRQALYEPASALRYLPSRE